jgi:hypothetical protein
MGHRLWVSGIASLSHFNKTDRIHYFDNLRFAFFTFPTSQLLTFCPSDPRLLSLGTRGLFKLCAMPHTLNFPLSQLLNFFLFPLPHSDFRIQFPPTFTPSQLLNFFLFPLPHACRGIVPPYRTTTGPPSEFICPLFSVREFGSVLICQFN